VKTSPTYANRTEINIRLPLAQAGESMSCDESADDEFSLWADVATCAPLCVSAGWLSI